MRFQQGLKWGWWGEKERDGEVELMPELEGKESRGDHGFYLRLTGEEDEQW